MTETIKKVIYFDENSAIDLLQIEKQGNLSKTVELVTTAKGGTGASIDASVEAGKRSALKSLFEKTTGFGGQLDGNIQADGSLHGSRIAKTILENSLLYDFLNTVEFRKRKPIIDITDEYKLSIQKNSMTYYATIAPFTEMMEGKQMIDGDSDISMSISKMNPSIRGTKGYFELVGSKSNSKRIFRFNIDSFRNNYRIHDLKRMKLRLYSICVGETTLADLNFETEFELNDDVDEVSFNGIHTHNKNEPTAVNNDIIPVYDVILAGVK